MHYASNVLGITLHVWTHWTSLQHGQNLHSRKKVIKMLHGRFVHVGKTSTDLQILGCGLHQNAFGGGLRPDPLGEL